MAKAKRNTSTNNVRASRINVYTRNFMNILHLEDKQGDFIVKCNHKDIPKDKSRFASLQEANAAAFKHKSAHPDHKVLVQVDQQS